MSTETTDTHKTPGGRSWLLRGARLLDPATGRDSPGDLLILDGRIAPEGARPPAGIPVLDLTGLTVTPGLTDVHVHIREPGCPEAESFESGCAAAAAGGFTTIVMMPNTQPPMDGPDAIRHACARAGAVGLVRLLPCGCVTIGRAGREPADYEAMARAGAAAFTDDGANVADESLLERALRACAALGKPLFDHALDPGLAGAGVLCRGAAAERLGLPGIPPDAERIAVERDIRAAHHTGAVLHVQHLSTAAGVERIRAARRAGIRVSAEATPHHLALTDEDAAAGGPDFKMNPPLCGGADRRALLDAVADGTIAILATDHAPHRAEDKQRGLRLAPFGVVGLETAVGVTYMALVRSGRMTDLEWLRRWTTGPAGLLGLPPPTLAAGAPADLCALDLKTEWTVRAECFRSRSRNTPFQGACLTGRAVMTWLGGQRVWTEPGAERGS